MSYNDISLPRLRVAPEPTEDINFHATMTTDVISYACITAHTNTQTDRLSSLSNLFTEVVSLFLRGNQLGLGLTKTAGTGHDLSPPQKIPKKERKNILQQIMQE
jgi:hypothetical protein